MRNLYFSFSSFTSRVLVSGAAALLLRAGAAAAQGTLPPNNPSQDLDRNWSLERSYDGNGNVVAESKQFTDALGRPTQAQARNAATKQVFATQTIHNTGGQPVLQTLAAPINNQGFRYQDGFIKAGGSPYGPANFEQGNANSPTPVDASVPGTLGYYFSQFNAQEPLTPITSYPFSLVESYEGPMGGTKRAAGPGDELRMGKGREAKGRDFPLRKEFDDYMRLRPQFVPNSPLSTLEYQGLKSVSINADGRESIVVANKEGQAIISCLSGPQYPALPVYGFISAEATNSHDANAPTYLDIHIPAAGSQNVTFTMDANTSGAIRIVNLLTDQVTEYLLPATNNPAAGPVLYVTLAPGFYRFISVKGTQWSYYEARYGNFSYTYYDDAGRVVATVAPNSFTANGAPINPAQVTVPSFVTRNTYDASGRLLATESDDEGRSEYVYAKDGRIRFSQSALQRSAGRFSYSNYDEVGRVVESGEYTPGSAGTAGVEFEGPLMQGAKQTAISLLLEAEDALFRNNQSSQPHPVGTASNGYEVDFLGSVGNFVKFAAPLAADQGGTYDLQVRYSNGTGSPRTMTLYVNDQAGQTVTFAPTAGWDAFVTLRLSAALLAGNNTLLFQYEYGNSGNINLDYLRVTSPLYQEAEEADFQNSNQNQLANVAGTSGGRVVDYLTAAGNYVEFTVTPPAGQSGTYELQMGYSAGAGGSRTMNLRSAVGGSTNTTKQVTFLPTAGWETFSTVHTTAWLQGGVANTVRVAYTGVDNGYINLDYLRAMPASSTFRQEAERAGISNSNNDQPNTNLSAASGGQDVGFLTARGNNVRFGATVPQAGTYTLRLRYSTGSTVTQTMSLLINGTAVAQLAFPGTNNWSQLATLTTTAALRPGLNSIQVLYGPSDNGFVDLDYLEVVSPVTLLAHDQSVHDILEDRTRAGGLNGANCAQRNQVWYDLPFDGSSNSQGNDSQLGGRKQEFTIGAVTKTKNDNATTWYSYDELGRVTWVVQDLVGVGVKTLDYQYDFSGNVLTVAYQQNQADAFTHYYTYDAAQRLTKVETSANGAGRTTQAEYSYYLHGPLKRVQVAGNLQGVDYTYTLQGALKAINHVNPTLEPGHDSPTRNGVQKDLFALTLDYFSGDYQSSALPGTPPVAGGASVPTRYDGTIQGAAWRTAASTDIHRVAYTYDEKSQLQNAQYGQWQRQGGNGSYLLNSASTAALREGGLSYDANGNIQSLLRTNEKGATADNFSYTYKPNTNQLSEVHTGSPSGATVLDYDYDALGQLTRQRDEQGQRYFSYDVTGKTTGVYLDAARQQPVVTFAYDDRGFRVSKTAYANGVTKTTYYVRDVAGNVLAVYDKPTASSPLLRSEVPLYGASRLGTLTHLSDGSEDYRYELNDHLGDARVVFHRPTATTETETMELGGLSITAAFQNNNLYRAGGGYNSPYAARLTGTQPAGQELKRVLPVAKGDTITFSAWGKLQEEYSARPSARVQPYLLLGAAATTDELPQPGPEGQRRPTGSGRWLGRLAGGLGITLGKGHVPAQQRLTIQGWIKYRVLDDQGQQVSTDIVYLNGATSSWQRLQLGVRVAQGGTVEVMAGTSGTGEAAYFDDLTVEQTGGLIVQEQHQYAFGAPLPGLSYTVGNIRYRHGYQGLYTEKDDETGFDSFELRLYSSRIGRWISYDPEKQFDSAYIGMGNNPISTIDPNGGWGGPGPKAGALIGTRLNSAGGSYLGGALRSGMSSGTRLGLQVASSVARDVTSVSRQRLPNGTPNFVPIRPPRNATAKFDDKLREIQTFFSASAAYFNEKINSANLSYNGNAANYWRAQKLSFFKDNVKSGAYFDLKYPEHGFSPKELGGQYATYNGVAMRFDDFGNYGFGLAAKAYGYSETFVVSGAGGYQWYDHLWNSFTPSLIFPSNLKGAGDDPRDTKFIIQGYHHSFK